MTARFVTDAAGETKDGAVRTFSLNASVRFTLDLTRPKYADEVDLGKALVERPEEILAKFEEALARIVKSELDDPLARDIVVNVDGTVLP